jgi:RNA polymerase sigma-70 factor (ECF subfamily)
LRPLFAKLDPDANPVAAARGGDARAFDALVCRHQEALQRFLRARLNRTLDADDVAQETFVAAWRELGEFRGRCRFKTWLFGIAMNRCADAARRQRRQEIHCLAPEELENGLAGRAYPLE